jgi:hypothetical protein
MSANVKGAEMNQIRITFKQFCHRDNVGASEGAKLKIIQMET